MQLALLAETHPGCGKTKVMLTLLPCFQNTKQHVTAFKSEPNFIDPFWHQTITGKPSFISTGIFLMPGSRLHRGLITWKWYISFLSSTTGTKITYNTKPLFHQDALQLKEYSHDRNKLQDSTGQRHCSHSLQ